jgi:REP element-mobilizing transposase RayT
MPQSLAAIYVHLIYSTKNRQPLIRPEIEEELRQYQAGILRNLDAPMICAGGTADHIHTLFRLGRKTCASPKEDVPGGIPYVSREI